MNTPRPPPSLPDVDPIDSRLAGVQGLQAPAPAYAHVTGRFPAVATPQTRGLVLLPLGLMLGPSGLNLLSDALLSHVDPLVSVALAVLGVFIGLALPKPFAPGPSAGPLVIGAMLESALTILLVVSGAAALETVWSGSPIPWLFALMLGICASASFSPSIASAEPHPAAFARLGDFDNVLAIALATVVLSVHGGGSSATTWLLVLALCAVAVTLAVAGWLLVGSAASESVQHAFVAGTLLLLGGTAAYLQQSALFVGLLAGLVWSGAGGAATERLARDVRYVQHPLVVLLLLVAGARLVIGTKTLATAAVYLLCRTIGKTAGAWVIARRRVRSISPGSAAYLIAPGVLAVALALNALDAAPAAARPDALLAIVALGSLATDLLSLAVRARGERS